MAVGLNVGDGSLEMIALKHGPQRNMSMAPVNPTLFVVSL